MHTSTRPAANSDEFQEAAMYTQHLQPPTDEHQSHPSTMNSIGNIATSTIFMRSTDSVESDSDWCGQHSVKVEKKPHTKTIENTHLESPNVHHVDPVPSPTKHNLLSRVSSFRQTHANRPDTATPRISADLHISATAPIVVVNPIHTQIPETARLKKTSRESYCTWRHEDYKHRAHLEWLRRR